MDTSNQNLSAILQRISTCSVFQSKRLLATHQTCFQTQSLPIFLWSWIYRGTKSSQGDTEKNIVASIRLSPQKLLTCPSLLFVSVINMTRERKGLFGLHFQIHHQRESGKAPGGSICCDGHGGALLTGLFLMACFLTELKTTSLGMAAPTMSWVLLHRWIIKKCPTAGSYTDNFSVQVPSSQLSLVCVSLT